MRDPKLQKITASVTLEVGQLERLNEAADRARVSRSTIVRDAIERELKRYETSNEVEEPLPKASGSVLPKTATRP
jgi:metal-responsive CopG/Arc/MetJ family transcriptional regulator